MLYVRTVAYNAEKTLPRAIESILNQTYKDFNFYICENGSTDDGKTRRIVEEYARQDKRIVPSFNEQNHIWDNNLENHYLANNIDDEDYFCQLDADDEYELTFLSEMLTFMNKHNLDIAACGSDLILLKTNEKVEQRKLVADLILEGDAFEEYFAEYHWYARTVWGKLFKGKTLRNVSFDLEDENRPKVYGGDTYITVQAFQDAGRVGILAKSLHKYYLNFQSSSYIWSPHRPKSDRILFDQGIRFLEVKAGRVSYKNEEFLFCVYLGAIENTLNILYKSSVSVSEKISVLYEIFKSTQTREMMECAFVIFSPHLNKRKKILSSVIKWLCSNEEIYEDGDIEKAAFLFSFEEHIPKKPEAVSHGKYFKLLSLIYDVAQSDLFKQLIKKHMSLTIFDHSVLKGIEPEFLIFFRGIIINILNEDYEKALDEAEVFITQEREVPEGFGIRLATLGLIISAEIERMEYFIFFKKVQVSLLLEAGQNEEAALQLADWDEIMADDEDFKVLKNKIKY